MGLFDKAKKLVGANKDKLEDLKDEHGDKVAGAVDKVTDAVDDKTGGKFTDKLDQVDEAARKAVD